ncbi:MAG: prepilin-type N-terminal cleavage/methylation domain-containing protein [Candidatus Ratteibacteria bacterium]
MQIYQVQKLNKGFTFFEMIVVLLIISFFFL